jgi:MYXO-CTERM domain-containing protein
MEQASACSPPPPGYLFNGAPELPLMTSNKVAVPLPMTWYYIEDPGVSSFVVEVTGEDGAPVAGRLELVILREGGGGFFETNSGLLIWRPEATMQAGAYKGRAESLRDPNSPGGSSVEFSFQVSRGAPDRQLAPPVLDASLRATAVGRAEVCCDVAERSRGFSGGECFDQSSYSVPEPLGSMMRCGMMRDDACRLCWPTAYDADPTLDASWQPAEGSLDPLLTYYEIELYGAGIPPQTTRDYNALATSRRFGTGDSATSYCVRVRAISMVDDQTAEVERCIDRDDMVPLPADPGAVTGVDRRMECLSQPGDDMGGRPDMGGMEREDELEFAPSTSASGDGCGCATQDARAPIAPLALLAAFGLMGWRRRRSL